MNKENTVPVTITLEFKDLSVIRYALGKIKCSCERQAKEEKNLTEKYMAQENAKYLAELEQKLYDAQQEAVNKARKERGLD